MLKHSAIPLSVIHDVIPSAWLLEDHLIADVTDMWRFYLSGNFYSCCGYFILGTVDKRYISTIEHNSSGESM